MARDVVAADLEHELEPGRGDERRRRRLPLEERVGGGGGPVEHAHDVLGHPSREGQDLVDGGHEAGGEIARGGRRLRHPDRARLRVGEGAVGEGAADVDGDGPASAQVCAHDWP